MKIAVYKDMFANNCGADIAVNNLATGLGERGYEVMLFDKSEFEAKVRGDYDVIISTGTNEILDLARVEGLPPNFPIGRFIFTGAGSKRTRRRFKNALES